MFELHSRCQSIETLLRVRVSDLEAEVSRLYEMRETLVTKAADRERELLDRLIIAVNPRLAGMIEGMRASEDIAGRSNEPAPNLPGVARGRGPIRVPLPGQRSVPLVDRTGVSPPLTPQTSAYRVPGEPSPPSSESTG